MSTEGHTLAGVVPSGSGFLAWCGCDVGFWADSEDQARIAWEGHLDRVAAAPRVRGDGPGREVVEADPHQYGREEDARLAAQLGAWPAVVRREPDLVYGLLAIGIPTLIVLALVGWFL